MLHITKTNPFPLNKHLKWPHYCQPTHEKAMAKALSAFICPKLFLGGKVWGRTLLWDELWLSGWGWSSFYHSTLASRRFLDKKIPSLEAVKETKLSIHIWSSETAVTCHQAGRLVFSQGIWAVAWQRVTGTDEKSTNKRFALSNHNYINLVITAHSVEAITVLELMLNF